MAKVNLYLFVISDIFQDTSKQQEEGKNKEFLIKGKPENYN